MIVTRTLLQNFHDNFCCYDGLLLGICFYDLIASSHAVRIWPERWLRFSVMVLPVLGVGCERESLVTNKLVLLVNRLDFTHSRSLMRVRGAADVGLPDTTGEEEKLSQQMLLHSCCYLETKKMQQIGHKILSI